MRTVHLISFFLLFLAGHAAVGQPVTTLSRVSSFSVIPFTLTTANNLSVNAILNRQDTVHLMFHTAANAVALTEEAVKTVKSLAFSRTDSVKSWGGSGNSSRFSPHNTLQLGNLSWQGLPIWEDKYSGPQTDGKFGINLFTGKVMELNFDTQLLTIRSHLPDNIGQYEKHKLITDNDMLFIDVSCVVGSQTLTNRFLLHSGYSGALLLDDQFVDQHHLDQQLRVISEKELKDSFGNVIKTQKAIVPKVKIGNQTLTDVPVGFFPGALGRQKMSILGGDLLKRFNVIIDAQREYIYLKPNAWLHKPYSAS